MAEQQIPLLFDKNTVLSADQIWHSADADLFRVVKEDRRVERKPASIKPPFLAEYFSMWANTAAEGGIVVVGMENDGAVSGCSTIEIKHINQLEQEAHDMCPDAHVECKRIDALRDKDSKRDFLLVFRVHYHETKVVKTVRGEAFIRRGEAKQRLTADELTDLRNDKQEVRIEQTLCPQYDYPDGFVDELLQEFTMSINKDLADNLTTEQALAARRLGRLKDGVFTPNAACVLLFARDPIVSFPGCRIHFLRFEGDVEGSGDQWNAVKELWIEGPVPFLLRRAEVLLKGQLRVFNKLGPDGRFNPAEEYPERAWYEALVNACVHRSYGSLKNIPISVKMFDSRLEIESPGPFPPAVTPENIYETHSPRNPDLMHAMWSIGFVKCAHEGTRRMLRLMQESELPPPEFKQRDTSFHSVRVTLRNDIKHRRAWIDATTVSVVSPEILASLTDDERRVINHIAEYGTINTSQAVRLTGRGWKSTHRLLLKLASRGLLRHHHRKDIDRDPMAHFTIKPPKSGQSGT